MKIVGLIGYAGVGKDHLARKIGWPRGAFADCLKEQVARAVGVSVEEIESHKEDFRGLLVEFGRTKRRLQPDYWIRQLEPKFWLLWQNRKALITDVRYLNEAQWVVDDMKGILIMVKRPGVFAANSEEEGSIKEIEESGLPYMTVFNVNDEGVEALKLIVEQKFKDAA